MRRLRYVLTFVLAASLLPVRGFGAPPPPSASAARVILFVDESTYIATTALEPGVARTADTAPVIRDGTTLVPVRLVAESLGASVTWVPATREIAIDQGARQIRLALDSETAVVTDGEARRSVRMAVPAQLVNNRTLIPVRAVAESFGVPIQWDPGQRSVWIGYTEQARSEVATGWLAAGVEPRALLTAAPFLADGPFADLTLYRRPVYRDPVSGAVIALDAAERTAAARDPQTPLGQAVARLRPGEVLFATGETAAIFSTAGDEVRAAALRGARGAGTTVGTGRTLPVLGWGQFAWAWEQGLVLTAEGTRIAEQFEVAEGRWRAFDPPVMLGTPTQRVLRHLRLALADRYISAQNPVPTADPLGLDPEEVAQYAATGSDAGLKSFQVIAAGGQNQPAFVVVTGGENGLSPDYMALMRRAMAELDRLDPAMIPLLVDRFGLAFFGKDIAGAKLFTGHDGWEATYDLRPMGGLVFFNEDVVRATIARGIQGAQEYRDSAARRDLRSSVMVESRGIYDLHHIGPQGQLTAPDRLNNEKGCDKTLWLDQQRQRLSGVLEPVERNYLEAVVILGLRYHQADCDPPVAVP